MVTRWLLVGYSLQKNPGMALIGHAHYSQSMEWHNLGITTLKHATCAPFLKVEGKPNKCQFCLSNFLKFCDNISHKLLRASQFLEKL